MTSAIDVGHLVSGDVIDLILDDHVRFETLLRQLRDSTSDRDAVRRAFAELHVAHATAEEELTILKRRNALIAAGCASLTQVRAIVKAAEREGLLDDDEE